MIMYRVSEERNSIEFTAHEIIKQTEVSVFYMDGNYKQREKKVKTKTIWFESREKALTTALSWSHELVQRKKYELICSVESNNKLVALGGYK